MFAIDDRRSLVAYSTEIEPAEMAEAFHAAIEEAVAALPSYIDETASSSAR